MTVNQRLTDLDNIGKEFNILLTKLLEYTKDKNHSIRYDAIELIPHYSMVLDVLIDALNDKNSLVRVQALTNIGKLPSMDMIICNVAKLLKDRNSLVKAYAIEVLGDNNAVQYKQEIEAMLKKTKNDEIKIRIYYTLIKFGDIQYINHLFEFLNNDFYRVRIATANTLCYLVNKENKQVILDKLQQRLTSENEYAVRETLKTTILDIFKLELQ